LSSHSPSSIGFVSAPIPYRDRPAKASRVI
jgi:hypothetical protein